MEGLFSVEAKSKFSRETKPTEFKKKKATLTPKLDEEEQAREDQRAARNLEKKAKRKVKPKKGSEEGGDEKKSSDSVSTDTKSATSTSAAKAAAGGLSKDERTVFLGNVPISQSEKSLTKFCSEFGEVISVRLRSLPVAGTAVDESGNQELVKKVCAYKKDFGKQKGSLNAYVVFKSVDAVQKALKANNRVMSAWEDEDELKEKSKAQKGSKALKSRHLRVDLLNPTLFDPSLSVFIGGVPHYADEEEIREHFAAALPNGQKDIHSVRLVRDAETLIGKGFGYILLSDKDAVMQALTLHQKKFKKRWELRVTVCGKRTKRVKNNTGGSGSSTGTKGENDSKDKNNKGKKREREDDGDEGEGSSKKDVEGNKKRWRDLSPEEQAAKKEAASKKQSKNASAALKRITKAGQKIQKGNKNTRSNVLKERGQMKKVAGRKGKRLGGNVKRAMKAEKANNKATGGTN